MNEPLIGIDGNPVISHDQVQQMQVAKLRTSLFLSLVPVVAAKRLDSNENWKGSSNADDIAEEANQITLAALRKMGICFEN